MPKIQSPEALVRDALQRAGRTDSKLLKRCLAETKGPRNGMTAREMAVWAFKMQGMRIVEGDGPIEIMPSRRDPALASELAEITDEEERLSARLTALHRRRDALFSDIVERRLQADGVEHGEIVVSEDHACDASPAGCCAYDADDGTRDICLFCGMPSERI